MCRAIVPLVLELALNLARKVHVLYTKRTENQLLKQSLVIFIGDILSGMVCTRTRMPEVFSKQFFHFKILISNSYFKRYCGWQPLKQIKTVILSAEEFNDWCYRNRISESSKRVIEKIRSSEPSRRVQSGRRNVSGSYPSRKMGVTIQFESHRNELARIYELEHDSNVLEYYDQPPSIELSYQAKSGKQIRHRYTPDFFIIRAESAGWEECKTEEDLIKLGEDSPNRYQEATGGGWRCLPGEAYAAQLGLIFWVWSSAKISWTFQQNFVWLEDYFYSDSCLVDEAARSEVLKLVTSHLGITLADLLYQAEVASPDDIHALIAERQIYIDLNAARLSEPGEVKLFTTQDVAFAHEQIITVSPVMPLGLHLVQVDVGFSVSWDGEIWEVVNTGSTTTGLLRADRKHVELPNAVFEELIQKGAIVASTEIELDVTREAEEILRRASSKDIAEANRRYQVLEPYLKDSLLSRLSSTLRRWWSRYREAEKIYGKGYIGLLPSHGAKGNRSPKVDEIVLKFMDEFIEQHYENLKQRRVQRVYESFVQACKSHEPVLEPPCRRTFTRAIRKRAGYNQTLKREGRRAAIQKEQFWWELTSTTPRHGNRPFEIVHIDHTQLDVELVSSLASLTSCNVDLLNNTIKHNLGRPWVTFAVDAFTRRLLAVYVTYEEPSYRSCMMVLRICVQRFKRFPQTIVTDNGSEFHSIYFEQLLATYLCTKKYRPPATARFGSVVERLFGTANTQFVHELLGNTQIMRQHRQVTKSVSPSKLAIWTLDNLYEAICHWAYEVYDQQEHPALGQSPRDSFASGLAQGGSRLHKRVEYDETFRILTLPAPDQGQRKVQPGQGVKIHNIYYWSEEFRDPEIEKSLVEVRYDPFDAGTAYAFVRGQWINCISAYYQYLQGRSEKEIRLASEELYKRKRKQGCKAINSSLELVQFLDSVEAKEGQLLEQHLRALENQRVLQIIDGGRADISINSGAEPAIEKAAINNSCQTKKKGQVQPAVRMEENESVESLEYYGEF